MTFQDHFNKAEKYDSNIVAAEQMLARKRCRGKGGEMSTNLLFGVAIIIMPEQSEKIECTGDKDNKCLGFV
jgi:hypothetical protein